MKAFVPFAEHGYVPDSLIRYGIRKLVEKRKHTTYDLSIEQKMNLKTAFIQQLNESPLAVHTDVANEQHYEIPAAFYELVLGTHKKYSSCIFHNDTQELSQAEADMLQLTCERAQLEDGMDILELGCGWGSLTLWMAKHYPNSHITAISNSSSQKDFIQNKCHENGYTNVTIITCDINDFSIDQQYDCVVSIEMFEHLRNYKQLLHQISSWLKHDGKLFVHIFTHKSNPYLFEVSEGIDWMAKHFFTGGMMPSDDLLLYFQDDLTLDKHWAVNGTHYEKTANAWLTNLDRNKEKAIAILQDVYGKSKANIWYNRWRIFFMSCAELFGFNHGHEWLVSHYRFQQKWNLGCK